MARKVRANAVRRRALSVVGILALVAGTTVGMVTAVGAEDVTTDESVTEPSGPTTTSAPEAPPSTSPPTTQPPTDALASGGPLFQPASHTNPPDPLVECQGTGSNSFESDERADPNGECTYGNVGSGPLASRLAECVTAFGDSVTNVYNSETASGIGNDDVTGAITPHPVDGGTEGSQLNVTADPGVVIDGVFVKGGSAYNAYIGNEPNMIAPLTGGDANFATISHYVVCYHFEAIETGGLDVTKTIVGDPPENTTFTISVDCDDGTDHDGTLVFDDTGTLTDAGTIDTLPITGIPVDTSCTVTETDNGGADSMAITGNPAVIVADTNQTVDVENTFEEPVTGSLQVEKEFEGGGVPEGGLAWTVTVTCDDPAFQTTVDFAPGDLGPKTVNDIPLDGEGENSCSVSETDKGSTPGGWTLLVAYDPPDGINDNSDDQTVDEETTPLFTVTNTYAEVAGNITVRLDVDKQVVGNIDPAAGTQFVVHVSCTGDATVDEDLVFTFPNGLGVQSITEDIPSLGSLTCTVTETDTGGTVLEGYQIDGGATQDGAPTIELDIDRTNASVTVLNDPGDGIEVGGISVGDTLPFTGSTTDILLKIGAWMLVIGGVAYLVTRRRRGATLQA